MQNRAGLRLFEYMEVYQMDFTLSKQQQMVQKMYKEFAENEVKPLAKKVDAEEYFPKETVEKMAKLGMMGIYFPKEVGGAGGDVLSYVMAAGMTKERTNARIVEKYKKQDPASLTRQEYDEICTSLDNAAAQHNQQGGNA